MGLLDRLGEHADTVVFEKLPRETDRLGIGILKLFLGESEKYPRGHRMSITPISGPKMGVPPARRGFPRLVPTIFTTIATRCEV
jgi:hypothetical protein